MCRSKNIDETNIISRYDGTKEVREIESRPFESHDDDPTHNSNFIGIVSLDSIKSKPWICQVLVNGNPVKFKIDLGADVTALSDKDAGLLQISEVKK